MSNKNKGYVKKVDESTLRVVRKGREYLVTHFDDYGVVVRGAGEIQKARKVLRLAGYPRADVHSWPYRPAMLDQEQVPAGSFGSPYGGTPSVCFYFSVAS